jgi:hypothetical protein
VSLSAELRRILVSKLCFFVQDCFVVNTVYVTRLSTLEGVGYLSFLWCWLSSRSKSCSSVRLLASPLTNRWGGWCGRHNTHYPPCITSHQRPFIYLNLVHHQLWLIDICSRSGMP